MPNPENVDTASQPEASEPDYKALYEKAQADAERWKAQSRKNESRAKSNAGAARDLDEVNQQVAELSQQLAAIQGENAALKAQAARSALVAKVAAETGVPEAIVSKLAPNDEEALTQAATAIADAYKVPGGAPAAPEAGARVQTGDAAYDKKKLFGDYIAEALG